jgi:hypothetical protein
MKLTQPSLSSPAATVVSALALNTSTEPGLARSGLVAEYRFNEGSGQILYDYSGNGRNGMLGTTGAVDADDPVWTAEGLTFNTSTILNVGAVSVGGVNQPLSAIHLVFYTASAITKSSTGAYILSWKPTGSLGLLGFGAVTSILTDEIIVAASGSSKRCGWCGDSSIAAGWHTLTLNTNSAGWYDLILDGVSLPLTTSGTSPAPQTIDNLTVGATESHSSHFTGKIAYLVIYNRALSSQEIASNVNYIEKTLRASRNVIKNG